MLVVIGDLVADVIVLGGGALERGTDNPAEVRITRGGSAANVAAAASARHPVRFIGRVGDDTIGRALVAELEAAGVDARMQTGARTGTIVLLVDDMGERTMITDRGASAELTAIDPAWLEGADWLHLPLYGFSAPASRQAIRDAAAFAARAGATISLDLSSVATLRDLGAETLRGILREISPDVVFANEDEARMADELGLSFADAAFIEKRGGRPVHVRSAGETHEVDVERVDDVLDSTGAGDAFAAGYITAALSGADARESARAGSELAMSALRRAGAL